MKNYYLAIASFLILGASYGQYTYNIDMLLTTPVINSTVARQAAQPINFSIKNYGPNDTKPGDTLYTYFWNSTQNQFYGLNGTPGLLSFSKLTYGIEIGMSVFSTQLNGGNQLTLNTLASGFNNGDVIYVVSKLISATNGTDSDTANDAKKFTLGTGSAGVEDATIATFKVYPNPAKDVLNFESEDGVASVSIFSLDGKLISTTKGGTVDVSGLTTGVYLYNASTLTGRIALNKFVKK